MADKLSRLVALLGVLLLLGAAILLMIGQGPESYWTNYQAETLANFAYGLFVLSIGLALFRSPKS